MAAVKLGNSFLDSPARGQKVLVIVPHEDDEINVAGSVMYSYVQKGADVYCAFTTNGDYSFWARTRMHEAWRSLQTLGVQHVVFLGYGDTSNHYPGGHCSILPKKPSQRRLAIMKRMAVTIFRIMLLLNEESIGHIAENL